MISLQQIQKLEARVTRAVELIQSLKEENESLRRTLDSAQGRMQELERLVGEFKADQKEIEQGILRAISSLDRLEDELGETAEEEEKAAAKEKAPSKEKAPKADAEKPAEQEEGKELEIF
jgi:FtsZ-binding cell division protein ZapB